jgi:microcystin-dependent protein
MPAVFENFAAGQVSDDPLTLGATTINSAGFAGLPEVVAPDFLWLSLDPDGVDGLPEVVKVTDHADLATSVTVVRGQQGTVAREHDELTLWRHAWTAADGGFVESVVPVGTIVDTLRDTAPAGWEFLAGQTLTGAQTALPALWAALPAAFKSGSDIVLPDLRGRVTVGAGTGSGLTARVLAATGGAETHTLTTAQLPSHAHTINHGHGTANTGSPINTGNTNPNLSTASPTAGSDLAGHTHGMNHVHNRGNHTHTHNISVVNGGGSHTHTVRYVANFGTGATPFNVGPVDTTGLNQSSNTVIPSGGAHNHTITGGITSSGDGATGVSRNTANTANRPNTDGPSNINHVHEFNHRHQVTVATHTGSSGDTGSGDSHNIMQPFVVVNKMIRVQ